MMKECENNVRRDVRGLKMCPMSLPALRPLPHIVIPGTPRERRRKSALPAQKEAAGVRAAWSHTSRPPLLTTLLGRRWAAGGGPEGRRSQHSSPHRTQRSEYPLRRIWQNMSLQSQADEGSEMRFTRTCALLALVAIALSCSAAAQIPQIERDALIALFDSTSGPLWSVNTYWLGPIGSECTWHGVTCSGGRVTGLNLYSNDLQGPLPPQLGELEYLKDLNLGYNHLNGGIPPELGNLTSLETLWLIASELQGRIPPELGNLVSLETMVLTANQLDGPIPPEIGNLRNLRSLALSLNRLSGAIPMELGNLASLTQLFLSSNRLSGGLPPELGNLSNLVSLILDSNQLSGAIPSELGSLAFLMELFIASNQLTGEIPAELGTLSWLQNGASDLRWNALHTDDTALASFLNAKQVGGDWQSSQTTAPENPTIEWVGDHTVWLSWDSPIYDDPGGFEAFVIPTAGGSWTSVGWTGAKTEVAIPATTLDPGVSYDFAVATNTLPHANNQNLVTSDLSEPVMATTANLGCAQPIIEVIWGDPTTLSVPGNFDSYSWNTGDTSPTIEVSPYVTRFYWVTVTSPGPCQESAIILIDENQIFSDGFENGNTSAWVR